MPVETDPSTSTSGGTTTVGATVRDGGPGGVAQTVDVFLHIESSKFIEASKNPCTPAPHARDSKRLSVWWKDQKVPAGGSLKFSYKLEPRRECDDAKDGSAFEGPAEATIVVCDRGASKLYHVRRFCICAEPTQLVVNALNLKELLEQLKLGPIAKPRKVAAKRRPSRKVRGR